MDKYVNDSNWWFEQQNQCYKGVGVEGGDWRWGLKVGVPINSLQIYGLDILTKSNDPPEDGSTCQLLYLQLPFNLNTTPTQRKMEIERERERNLNKPLQEQEFTTAAAAAAITTNKQTNKQTVYVLSIRKSWKMKCVTYFLINGWFINGTNDREAVTGDNHNIPQAEEL